MIPVWSVQVPAIVHTHGRGQFLTDEAHLHHLVSLARGEFAPGSAAVLPVVLFSFGPSLAEVLVTGLFHGGTGLKDLARRATKARVPARWVLIVLLAPAGLWAGSLLAGWVLGVLGGCGTCRPTCWPRTCADS